MCDVDIDITQSRRLRLGVALRDRVLWDSDTTAERIRGVDLSDLARKSASRRRDHPDVDVVADIDVVIAAEARTARAMLSSDAHETCDGTLLYVGTPPGLASLITDIHALGIADGAVLIPRAAGVADLIRDAVLPLLHTSLQLPAVTPEARPA
jgi:alkanesulfonate monooxygenase SsuD/methylene tetrahydromethanopterin reductase-like flavin-dependent oxidoreductase (luciferase family)